MNELNSFTYEQGEVAIDLMLPDSTRVKADLSSYRDAGLRAMRLQMIAYMAKRRTWETKDTIGRVLTWRERLAALFGKEVATGLEVKMYRNCPHLPTTDSKEHAIFLSPDLRKATQ